MNPRSMRCWSGIIALLLAGPALADSPEQWLARMHKALDSISYRGTLVSVGSNRVDTLRIIHRVDDNGVRERIYALDGVPREVLRDRDSVYCLIDGQSSVVVDNPFPRRLLATIPLREIVGEDAVYRLREIGSGRVAGRDARIFEFEALDQYRYGRRLWLDERTGLPLRSGIHDRSGNAVEKLSFVDIELDVQISDEELASELAGKVQAVHYTVGRDNAANNPAPSWVPVHLPPGFRLASVGRGGEAGQEHEHLLFSDGLASFSVYVENAGELNAEDLLEARGATHIYSTVRDGRLVTVVGEVPAPTVHLVGSELRRLTASGPGQRD